MSQIEMLRLLITQRLTAAAEEIFGVFGRTIAEYEDEISRSKMEISRQRRLLELSRKPQVCLQDEEEEQEEEEEGGSSGESDEEGTRGVGTAGTRSNGTGTRSNGTVLHPNRSPPRCVFFTCFCSSDLDIDS
ncbi:hypothetical protein EYF80_054467 [Liparis tanakae]|uniref:Uncharacterized protein n=1 Tax=Liparis tanakae TaxID=230148 RepID=A0A4Z2F2U2_9TELE|nr:hypothetical protein EYF80_054467 [Liparis tanakae]